MAKVPPVNLSDFAWCAREAQIGFDCASRSMHRDNVSKMIGTSAVAAFAHHRVEAASGQRWKALQCLEHERYVRVGFGNSCRALCRRHARATQHSLHRSMMNLELARNRADPPLFNVIIAQNLCFEFRRYTHKRRSLMMQPERAERRRSGACRIHGWDQRPQNEHRNPLPIAASDFSSVIGDSSLDDVSATAFVVLASSTTREQSESEP